QPRAEKIGTICVANNTLLGSTGAPRVTLPSATVTAPAADGSDGMSIVVTDDGPWVSPTSPTGTSKNTAQPEVELAVAVAAAFRLPSRKRGPVLPAIAKSLPATPDCGWPAMSIR